MKKKIVLGITLLLSISIGSYVAWANLKPSEQTQEHPALSYFTDMKLTDQNGKQHRLYSDLMKDKVVVIDAFFSGCENTCVTKARTFQKLQAHLGGQLGYTVNLMSFSVDSKNDTQEVLRSHAEKLGAREGWYFFSGKNAESALKKLGQYVDRKETHKDILLVGNLKTGLWKKAFGLAPADKIIALVDGVRNDPGE